MLKLRVIGRLVYFLISFGLFTIKILNPPATVSPLSSLPTITPTNTPTPVVIIGLVGDLGLGRFITYTARSKNDFSYSFKKISPWLVENDINLANLESPIVDDCPTVAHNTFKFCGDPKFLPFLSSNKFVFNLANNHIFNYGQDGFNQTTSFLDQFSIPYFYSHSQDTQFIKQNINGISLGFLGFDMITNPNMDTQKIVDLVSKYDQSVDWLIVSIHWGNEYKQNPEVWRINLAHQLIDAGADIVHGHHPHVWQEYEIYHQKPIFYSLGNFIFDQNWSQATSQTNIIRLKLTKGNIIGLEKFPVLIQENCQPIITD